MNNQAYDNKDYNYLFKQALTRAKTNGLLNVTDEVITDIVNGVDIENIYSLFLSVYTDTLAEYYIDAQNIYEANDLKLATGNDLDIIGVKLGLPRYEPTKASTTLQFTTNDTLTQTITVPSGIEVTGTSGITYVTTESFTLDPGKNTAKAGALSKTSGTGSRISTGDINKVTSSITGLTNITVTNTTPSYGGTDAETDTDYRVRLGHWRSIEQKGNEYAYRNVLDNLDGLNDYRIVPKWDGAGTVKVITIPGTATIKNNVYNALESDAVRITEDITVVSAIEYPIEVYCSINVDYDTINPYSTTEKEDIKNRTSQAITDYIGALGIGEDFIPFKCGVYLNNTVTELKDVNFVLPESVVSIDDESIITLTSVTVIIE